MTSHTGMDRHIEVKTTGAPASNAFSLSLSEIAFRCKRPGSYDLMRPNGYSYAHNSANLLRDLVVAEYQSSRRLASLAPP